jgi:hypothetical protein
MIVLSPGCDGRSVSPDQDGSHSLLDAGDAGDMIDVIDMRDSLPDVVTVTCGDGVRGGDEVCDGVDLGGVTCADLPGFVSGVLGCLGDCSGYDTAGCVPAGPGCGNQAIDPGEVCDGVDLDGLGCTDFGYAEGDLWCAGDCSGFLLHGCYPPLPGTCGDGVLEEWCDGNLFIDDCEYFGFTGGTLGCTAGCHYDFSGCIGDACAAEGLYGNGDCDPCPLMGGTEDPDCAQYCGVADGWCTSYVFYELGIEVCSVMTGLPDPDCGVCGNGVADWYESCDGNDMGFMTCQDLDFSGGTLACDANCIFDTAGCVF